MDYTQLSDEALLAEKQLLQEQRDAIKAKQMAIQAELDRRAVLAKLGGLNAAERAALAQVIAPAGAPSQAAFGTPGA